MMQKTVARKEELTELESAAKTREESMKLLIEKLSEEMKDLNTKLEELESRPAPLPPVKQDTA